MTLSKDVVPDEEKSLLVELARTKRNIEKTLKVNQKPSITYPGYKGEPSVLPAKGKW